MEKINRREWSKMPEIDFPFFTVISCGGVVHKGRADYEFEALCFGHKEETILTIDLNRPGGQFFIVYIGLGARDAFRPGTVFKGKQVHRFSHQYNRKFEHSILRQEGRKVRLMEEVIELPSIQMEMWDDDFWFSYSVPEDSHHQIHALPVIAVNDFNNYEKLIIPCPVIADYYFYGMPKMVKYILQQDFSRTLKRRNHIYNPILAHHEKDEESGKIIANIRLEKEMDDSDAPKIARLAHDEYFWNSCMVMVNKLISYKGVCYMETDFPVAHDVRISFYGIELLVNGKKIFFVQSISKCLSQPPFDTLIISRDNPGNKGYTDPDFYASANRPTLQSGNDDDKKELFAGTEKKDEPAPIGDDYARYNSLDLDLYCESDQEMNFDLSKVIDEQVLLACAKGENGESGKELLIHLGINKELTTEIEKKGGKLITRVVLKKASPSKNLDQPQVTCFGMIEKAVQAIGFENETICPHPQGLDIYSRFKAEDFEPVVKNDDKLKQLRRRFCYYQVQKRKHTVYRRIFIKEIKVRSGFFYVLDIQPTFVTKRDKVSDGEFRSTYAIIVAKKDSGCPRIDQKEFEGILKNTVENLGSWKFLDRNKFIFQRIRHVKDFDKLKDKILRFIEKYR